MNMNRLSFLIFALIAGCSSSDFMPPGHEAEVQATQKAKDSRANEISYVQISENYGISSKSGVDVLRDNEWNVIEHPTCDIVVFAHKGKTDVRFGGIEKEMNFIARKPKTRTKAWGIGKVKYKAQVVVPGEECPFYQIGEGKIKPGNAGAGIWNSKGELAAMALGKVRGTKDIFYIQLEPLKKWIEVNGLKAVNSKPRYRYKSIFPAVIEAPLVSQ